MDNIYYGRGRDEENKPLIAFLDEVFFTDDPDERAFLEILPKIYKDKYRPAYCNFVAQEKDTGVFRAGIGNFYADYLVGGETIKACCIGNVAVGRSYRGMGYMIKLMEMSVEDMKQNGTDLAYLGGQRQRYGYFGFEHAGVAYRFGFSRSAYRHALNSIPSGFEIQEMKADDTDTIKKVDDLYRKNPVAAIRPVESYDDIMRSWRQVPYILRENGEFAGYIVLNKPHNTVEDFGVVNTADMPRLVAAAFETAEKKTGEKHGLCFCVGPQETEKLDFFCTNADGIDMGGCEMILVYDYRKVIEAYMRAKASYTTLLDGEETVLIHGVKGDENLTITVKDNAVCVAHTDNKPSVELDAHAAVRAFFSLHSNDRNKMPAVFGQWLPLPMYQCSCDTM